MPDQNTCLVHRASPDPANSAVGVHGFSHRSASDPAHPASVSDTGRWTPHQELAATEDTLRDIYHSRGLSVLIHQHILYSEAVLCNHT